jgi:hypothetical protein
VHDFDPLIAALTGRAVTPALIDAARSHLVMLRSLSAEVADAVPRLVPTGGGGWRSTAADRYAERLGELRARLRAACESLDGAESQLVERIRRLEAQLEAQVAGVEERNGWPSTAASASPVRYPSGRDGEWRVDEWTTR